MAQTDSCLSNTIVGCQYYVEYQTGNCIQNCSSSTVRPYVQGGVLYCYP